MEVANQFSPLFFLFAIQIHLPVDQLIPTHLLLDQQEQLLAFAPKFLHPMTFLKILTLTLSCWISHFQLSCGQIPATYPSFDITYFEMCKMFNDQNGQFDESVWFENSPQ